MASRLLSVSGGEQTHSATLHAQLCSPAPVLHACTSALHRTFPVPGQLDQKHARKDRARGCSSGTVKHAAPSRTASNYFHHTRDARPAHLRDAGAHQPAADDCHMLDQDLLGSRRRRGRRGHGTHELPGHERHSSVKQRRRSSGDSARGPGASWAGSVTLGAGPRSRSTLQLHKLQIHPGGRCQDPGKHGLWLSRDWHVSELAAPERGRLGGERWCTPAVTHQEATCSWLHNLVGWSCNHEHWV